MHIKRYTLFVMIFLIVIGWYIYGFITQQSIPMDLKIVHLPSLPIAFWVMVPVFLLYLVTLSHMLYYSMVGSFKLRKYRKDYEKLMDALQYAYLGKNGRKYLYKTDRYALIGKLVDHSEIHPFASLSHVGDEKIDKVLALLRDIKNGTPVALNKYGLDKSNPLVIQNQINQMNKDQLKPSEVLMKAQNYDEQVCKYAFVKLIPEKPLYELEKYKAYMDKESLFSILARINEDKNKLDVSTESMISLLTALPLNDKEFVKASKILSGDLVPQQRVEIFELLSEKDETAMPAYLYTLYDLEMVDHADEILKSSQPDEFIGCKAYRELKDSPQNYSIDLFIR